MPDPQHNIAPLELSFAVITPICSSIAQIEVNKDVEICLDCVDEMHETFSRHFGREMGVLVNKINPYSYSSGAQFKIISSPQIKAIAVVHHSTTSLITTQTMQQLPQNRHRNMQHFWERDEAIKWLQKEVGSIITSGE